jgi:hypothetical protein
MTHVGFSPMSESNQTINIPVSRYLELLRNEAELRALQRGGVENWEWYEDAMAAVAEYDEDE